MSYYLPGDDSEEALRVDRWLDSQRYVGHSLEEGQPNAWPRAGVTYYDPVENRVRTVPEGTTPTQVLLAAQLLLEHYQRHPEAGSSSPVWDSITLGPLSVSNSNPESDARPIPEAPSSVTAVLTPLLRAEATRLTWWRAW